MTTGTPEREGHLREAEECGGCVWRTEKRP